METKKAPQIPYGISDFVRMRTENYYYVDKTMYLPLIEDTASYIFMIRPRRFGKSLFLSIMKALSLIHIYAFQFASGDREVTGGRSSGADEMCIRDSSRDVENT